MKQLSVQALLTEKCPDFKSFELIARAEILHMFGDEIRYLRLYCHMSLRSAGTYLGIDPSNLARLEKGKHSPSFVYACYIKSKYRALLDLERDKMNRDALDSIENNE